MDPFVDDKVRQFENPSNEEDKGENCQAHAQRGGDLLNDIEEYLFRPHLGDASFLPFAHQVLAISSSIRIRSCGWRR